MMMMIIMSFNPRNTHSMLRMMMSFICSCRNKKWQYEHYVFWHWFDRANSLSEGWWFVGGIWHTAPSANAMATTSMPSAQGASVCDTDE